MADFLLNGEVIHNNIECEHFKGTFGIGDGELVITNMRVIWKTNRDKVTVNIPLSDVGRTFDCKKGLRKGVTLQTKSGEAYNFFIPNLGNPQILKDILAPYASTQ
jgi:hypothetical protein